MQAALETAISGGPSAEPRLACYNGLIERNYGVPDFPRMANARFRSVNVFPRPCTFGPAVKAINVRVLGSQFNLQCFYTASAQFQGQNDSTSRLTQTSRCQFTRSISRATLWAIYVVTGCELFLRSSVQVTQTEMGLWSSESGLNLDPVHTHYILFISLISPHDSN